jgi:hypothetical protein
VIPNGRDYIIPLENRYFRPLERSPGMNFSFDLLTGDPAISLEIRARVVGS